MELIFKEEKAIVNSKKDSFPDLDLNHLKHFVMVVKCKSLSSAAKILDINKSKISRSISSLEQVLAVQLFAPNQRPLKVTDIGHQLYTQYAPVFNDLNAITKSWFAQKSDISGTIRLSIPNELSHSQLFHSVPEFCNLHPNLSIEMLLTKKAKYFSEQDFDVALTITSGEIPGDDFVGKRLFEGRRTLVCSKEFLQTNGPITQVEQLTKLATLAHFDKDYWQFYQNKKLINVLIEPKVKVDSIFMQMRLAQQGMGIALLPYATAESLLKNQELVEVSLPVEPLPYAVNIHYPPVKFLPAKSRAFIEFVKNYV